MSWHLRGSYVETCSCELMCPCNLSFDHGATYDFCRVTLVFNIREGAVDGTDIAGCKVAIIADTPKIMTRGRLAGRACIVGEEASDAQFDAARAGFQRPARRPDGRSGPAHRRTARRRARRDRDRRRRVCDTAVRVGDGIDFEIEDIVPFGVETGEPVRFAGMFHPVASDLTMAEAKRSRINAFGIQYDGKTGLSTSDFSWAA